MNWEDFLRKMADEYDLSPAQSQTFIKRFGAKYQNHRESDFYEVLLSDLKISQENYKKQLTEIYKKFTPNKVKSKGCSNLENSHRNRFQVLLRWLQEQYELETAIKIAEANRTTSTIEELKIDWNYICSQMLLFTSSKAIHKLNLHKIPQISTKLKSYTVFHDGSVIECEDVSFYKEILSLTPYKNTTVLSQSVVYFM